MKEFIGFILIIMFWVFTATFSMKNPNDKLMTPVAFIFPPAYWAWYGADKLIDGSYPKMRSLEEDVVDKDLMAKHFKDCLEKTRNSQNVHYNDTDEYVIQCRITARELAKK